MELLLGSQSPRRAEILRFFSLPFRQVVSNYNEEDVVFSGDPVAFAKAIATGKANLLKEQFPKHVILTADTVVFKQGKIYGKPNNEKEAFDILSDLNGSWHQVFTALTVVSGETMLTECEETKVHFHQLTSEHIKKYHLAYHAFDKAGGYGIQEGGSIIIKKIEGCFYNVMGLPLSSLSSLLGAVGIDLWNFLK